MSGLSRKKTRRVGRDHEQPELRRTRARERDLEHVARDRHEVDVDHHQVVPDDEEERGGQLHQRRKPQADEDQKRRNRIALVVDVKAVALAADVADAGEGAIERIAPPVNDEAERRQPQPVQAVLREDVGGADHDGRDQPDHRQRVRRYPLGKPVGHARQGPLFEASDRGLVDPFFGDGLFHAS